MAFLQSPVPHDQLAYDIGRISYERAATHTGYKMAIIKLADLQQAAKTVCSHQAR
jgi:hypothetical protein